MNNEEYLISVIVPVYNVEKYLDECVESIVNQTYKNLEIILVDDGSTDNSYQMCNKWAEKDGRIKVIHKKNGGTSSAKNCAIGIAQGDYVGFIDSDDFIDNDMFELLLNNALEYSAEISRCSYRFFENGKFVDSNEINDEIKIYTSEQIIDDLKYSGNLRSIACNKLFLKKAIVNVRFNENLYSGEDTVFVYQAYKNVNKVVCRDIAKYTYRMHSNHLSAKPDFNYQCYRAMKTIISDPDCPNGPYFKFFTFAAMTLNDIVLKGFDYDFDIIRKDILNNKKKIKAVIKNLNNKRSMMKLMVLSVSSFLYKALLKLGV
ncbi:MAG: glycosyltransferase family 2 protein [Eubacterium sp.]